MNGKRATSAFALLAAIACGDSGTGTVGSITVTASPTSLTLAQGASGTVTVTLARGGGFSEAVSVTVEGLPTGVTATVAPTQLTGTTTSAIVTVNVASTVPAGTYPITVRGAATGIGAATATYSLTVTAAPIFTISATPAALSIAAGASGNSSVAIVRTNFTTDVALSLVNPPTGITGVFTPATLTGATLASTLAISIASNVAAATYPITVRGTGGSVTQNTTVNVTVTAAASASLSIAPTTLSIQQGASGQATLTATRVNFTGTITPSVSGNPAGMTVTFNPATLTGSTSAATATVNVGSGVVAGNYTLTITGGGAPANPTATLAVTVTPSAGNVVWEFCNAGDVPLKFWRLSGGTWAEVAPTVVGNVTRFSFSVTGTNTGVAFTVSRTTSFQGSSRQAAATRNAAWETRQRTMDARATRITHQVAGLTSPYFYTEVLYALSSELAGYGATCMTAPTLVTKNFTVAGQSTSEEGLLGYGGTSATLTSSTTSYNVMVKAGTYDYLALFGAAPTFPSLAHNWSSYRLGRGEVAPGSSAAINRAGATAFSQVPFTVTGGAAGSFNVYSQSLEGSRGAVVSFPIGDLMGSPASMVFLASGDRLTTDMNSLLILNTELAGNVTNSRASFRYFGSGPPSTTSFALPQTVPAFATAQVSGAPVTTWSVTGQIPTDYQLSSSFVNATFTGAGSGTLYNVGATRGYLTGNGMSTSYTLAGPVLPGFLPGWAPPAPLVDATVIMAGSSLTAAPVAGSVINVGTRMVQSP